MAAYRPGPEDAQLIPRVIHRVWLGGAQIPGIFEQYAERWRTYHPSWEMRLWRDDTLPTLASAPEFEKATSFKERYDIVRLEIVRLYGGVIVDMDVEPIRPLDPLLRGVSAFVGRVGERHVGNQVLGAVPSHPFFEHAVRQLHSTVGVASNSSRVAGKDFVKHVLAQHPEGVTVFPADTFYYEPSFEPPRRPEAFPDVYAVHHELASYAALLPMSTIEDRLEAFVGETADALKTLSANARVASHDAAGDSAAQLDHIRDRLDRAERKVRRALLRYSHGYQAKIRQVEAEREQAEVRLAELHRQAGLRLEQTQKRLEQRRLVPWIRKLSGAFQRWGRPGGRT